MLDNKDQQVDWSKDFKALLSSPLGRELLRTLQERRTQLLQEAQDEKLSDRQQLRLLNQAGGVTKAIAHLEFRAVVPKDEGGQV